MAKAEDDKGAESKANDRARTRAQTKASEVMARTNEDEVAETTEGAETKTGRDVRTESKEDDVTVNIHNLQKFGTEQLESNTTAASSVLDTLQAIAAEASDYSRWSLENGSSFLAKLLGVTTFESAIQIQSEHAKTSYAGFIAYLMKLTELQADLAKEFFKPIETVVARVQGGNE
jgi:hypothetical protein